MKYCGIMKHLLCIEFGFKCSKEKLETFLNYLLCYTGELKLFLIKHSDQKERNNESIEIKELINGIKTVAGNYHHQLALSQLEAEREKKLSKFETGEKTIQV